MRLKSIKLKGFRGVKAGIGIDELFIDLSALPDGLIAITGPNGSSKTTILDNLHPFRIQPFKIRKAKDWSPAAFSYYDQCFGSDAMKELIFEMGGVTYKSLILIDSERRKQEAYLYQDNYSGIAGSAVSGWTPLNDGKTKTYDEAIEKVCGSPSLFFTSVFRCQGAKNLSDYSRGDIMSVISELLNIDHIRQQSDKCRVVVNGLSAGLASVRSKLDDLNRDAGVITELQHRISELDAGIAADHLLLAASKKDLESVQSALAAAKERKAAQESERSRLEMLQSQLAAEKQRLADADIAAKRVAADYDRRMNELKSARDRFKVELGGKVARAEKIASGGEAIRQAVDSEADLVAQVERHNAEITRLRTERDALKDAAAEYEKKLAGVNGDVRNAELSASRLDGLDCRADGSGWLNPECKLISAAINHRDSLEGWRQIASDLDRRVTEDRVALVAYSESLGVEIGLYDEAVAKLDECRKFTRLLPELDLAEANLVEWRRELDERDKSVASELKDLDGDKWCADAESDIALSRIWSAIRDLESQISTFIFADEDAEIRDLSVKFSSVSSTVDGIEKSIRDSELAVSGLQARLEVARDRLAGTNDLNQQAIRYEREIAKFSLLMKACSNDGIVALELDDSLPSIAAICNDLLSACYGSRFTIRMDTQSARVDGSLKEDFDIVVFDSETGDERSVTELSGGQSAYVNDALTRGICLFNIQSRGKTYGTLFADEVDGALDAGRKMEFLNIKREALRIGSHSRELFISQSPELIEMADARIVLGNGGVSIC